MNTKTNAVSSKKQALLDQLNKIQSKLDNIDKQRAEKITKIAKKYKLLELDEKIIENEFLLIRDKYLSDSETNSNSDPIKKN